MSTEEGEVIGSSMDFEGMYKNLADFQVISTENGPSARSGHRVFVTHDHLFVIGGFCRQLSYPAGKVFHEVCEPVATCEVYLVKIWCMNLLTRQWLKLKTFEGFPKSLASFAISQFAPYSNEILLSGGTDLPFGVAASSETFVLHACPSKGQCVAIRIAAEKSMGRLYGHALVRRDAFLAGVPEFYAVGGTTGTQFFLNVHRLSLSGDQWAWTTEAQTTNEALGLYRLEVICDHEKLIFFGGGTPDRVKNFEELTVFNLSMKEYGSIRTIPDSNHGFPAPRRCHSISQWRRQVVLVGGCSEDMVDAEDNTHVTIHPDVWVFNLDTFMWIKYPHSLKEPVFFHDAALTQDGCLYIFGGVSERSSQKRCNTLQCIWLNPPSLKYLALMRVFESTSIDCRGKMRAFISSCPHQSIEIARNATNLVLGI